MPCLRVHIEDATGAAGLRRRSKSPTWPYVLAIGVAAGVLIGLAASGESVCRPSGFAAGTPAAPTRQDASETSLVTGRAP